MEATSRRATVRSPEGRYGAEADSAVPLPGPRLHAQVDVSTACMELSDGGDIEVGVCALAGRQVRRRGRGLVIVSSAVGALVLVHTKG